MGYVCVGNMRKLEITEMRMLRLMRAVTLQDRITNAYVRNRFGIEYIGGVVRRCRLCWFGHVARLTEEDWVKKVLTFDGK